MSCSMQTMLIMNAAAVGVHLIIDGLTRRRNINGIKKHEKIKTVNVNFRLLYR